MPNHYETLDVPTNATPAEIKKQFYTLSKSHHPDLHPNDSSASQRFVKISEAYATLGNATKRTTYDHDFLRSQGSTSFTSTPRGSYSSASTPAGGRPASGLSRRRTQFRGPPPSFYQSGGYGNYGSKREEAASNASHTYEARGESQSGPQGGSHGHNVGAGMGPGGYTSGFDNDVPHFDQRGHYRTHNDIERTRHKARRRTGGIGGGRVREEDLMGDGGAGDGAGMRFVLVCGILATIVAVPVGISGLFSGLDRRKKVRADSTTSQGG